MDQRLKMDPLARADRIWDTANTCVEMQSMRRAIPMPINILRPPDRDGLEGRKENGLAANQLDLSERGTEGVDECGAFSSILLRMDYSTSFSREGVWASLSHPYFPQLTPHRRRCYHRD
jgi:hypothetical protein